MRGKKQKNPTQLKKKLMSAVCMLLLASILMTTTSYAWLVLSIAPEVTGISTNVGANGALEIALLTTETRQDLSKIRTTVGETLKDRNPAANNTWGNLIDLSYEEYGLGTIQLMPARLNLITSGDAYYVDTGMLSVPTYGFDGRIEKLTDDTISAVYGEKGFTMVLGDQDYGVRAVGTANSLSVQGSALAMAKSNIATYTNSARSNTVSVINTRGGTLFSIVLTHTMDAEHTYGEEELNTLKSMLESLQGVLDYIDLAQRQGAVALAASRIADSDTFTTVKDKIMDTSRELSVILTEVEEAGSFSEEFLNWLDALDDAQNDLNAANAACAQLTGGNYTWAQIRGVLDYIMAVDKLYINDTLFGEFDTSTAGGLLGGSVKLTLAPGSGILADIADFAGNFESMQTYVGTNITIATASAVNPSYLSALAASVKDLEPAESNGSTSEEKLPVDLSSIYGYALDMAFRCNAVNSDLLLQTTPENRIYAESSSGPTMGGGSYMEFSTKDNSLSVEQMIQLMDAIRVAFVDDQNKILGIAKLNTSNRTIIDGVVNSPLYLYEYGLSEEDGSVLMGERRLSNNVLAALTQNEAKAVTAVVWLDGDIVDNTMVSATESSSLNGVLNLQFATSADLVPATERDLLNITADLSDLQTLVAEKKAIVDAGQGTYTTVSWEAFITAYKQAETVSKNAGASDLQVYHASANLTKAFSALEQVSQEAISAQIKSVRDMMGKTDQVERYVIMAEDGGYITLKNEEHTQEEHNSWDIKGTVYAVDYNKNLHDEGNDIFTPIYTDESWLALADALYQAEAVVMNDKATDSQLNTALTNLMSAYDALERMVFYSPYEYNGQLYYEAICDAANADTYGKWYDSNFKRVVADLTILNLDAYAEPTDVVYISQDDTISNDVFWISPTLLFYDGMYPSLRAEEFQGVNWSITNLDPVENPDGNTSDSDIIGSEMMTWKQYNRIEYLIEQINFYGLQKDETKPEKAYVDTTEAEQLLISYTWTDSKGKEHHTYDLREDVTAAQADAVITQLEKDMAALMTITYVHGSQWLKLDTAVAKAKNVEGFEETDIPADSETESETESGPDLTALRAAVAKAEIYLEGSVTAQEVCNVLQEINQWYSYDVSLRNESDPDLLADEIRKLAGIDDYGYPTLGHWLLLRATAEKFENAATAENAPAFFLETYQKALDLLAGNVDEENCSNVNTTLEEINTELSNLGYTAVTDQNTVPDHIHGGNDIFQIQYPSKYPELPLSLTGKTGNVRLTAQVLTKNGIVCTLSKDLYVYIKPYGNGVDINGSKLDINYDLTIAVGETATLRGDLRTFNYCGAEILDESVPDASLSAYDQQLRQDMKKQIALGNLNYKNVILYTLPYVRYEPVHPAHPKSYSWSTQDTNLVTITGKEDYSCTVEGKAPGVTKITVLIITEEGNYVTETITVTVKKA